MFKIHHTKLDENFVFHTNLINLHAVKWVC